MKYIRTKDGIYKWDCPIENLVGSEIVKRADTIEELCDYAIVVSKDKPNDPHLTKIWSFKELYEVFTNATIYGAIWVQDKGIITVAKILEITDTGEIKWELL